MQLQPWSCLIDLADILYIYSTQTCRSLRSDLWLKKGVFWVEPCCMLQYSKYHDPPTRRMHMGHYPPPFVGLNRGPQLMAHGPRWRHSIDLHLALLMHAKHNKKPDVNWLYIFTPTFYLDQHHGKAITLQVQFVWHHLQLVQQLGVKD